MHAVQEIQLTRNRQEQAIDDSMLSSIKTKQK